MSAEYRETLRLAWPLARELGRASYRASTVQALAVARARQPWRPRKPLNPWLWQYVKTHLAEGCSPKQIAGRLQRAYPDDRRKHLSTETIDVGLYVVTTRNLDNELLVALRQARKA